MLAQVLVWLCGRGHKNEREHINLKFIIINNNLEIKRKFKMVNKRLPSIEVLVAKLGDIMET
jgi:hypothetical protein